jgi:3',5'-cyclic AMP phosphodiesterase CpdA
MTAAAALIACTIAADFRFAIVGDNTGRAKPGVFETVWRAVDKTKPAFAINIGDVIEGLDDAKAQAEWQAFAPLFKSLGKYPRYFVAGNHDIWSPLSREAYVKFTGRPANYGFDYKGLHVTVVDNSETESLSASQLDFLEKDLAAHQNSDLRFVFFHKPYWLIPLKLQSLQMPLHQMMKKYRVHSVFSGHVHQTHRIEREGIVYWCVPSSGGDLRGNNSFEQGWFYGYLTGEVSKGKARFTIHELPAPHGGGQTLAADKWGENGPAAPSTTGMPK